MGSLTGFSIPFLFLGHCWRRSGAFPDRRQWNGCWGAVPCIIWFAYGCTALRASFLRRLGLGAELGGRYWFWRDHPLIYRSSVSNLPIRSHSLIYKASMEWKATIVALRPDCISSVGPWQVQGLLHLHGVWEWPWSEWLLIGGNDGGVEFKSDLVHDDDSVIVMYEIRKF